jgi:pimeloyl-ACP methyl ester carboxylesterase
MFERLRQWFAPRSSDFRSRSVLCGGVNGLHRMAYTEWGEARNPEVVVCVHGLTRNGRDFDTLARALASRYRVVCPDVVGRGRSDWLKDASGYGFPQYVPDMLGLIARLEVEKVNWVGTSMGGLIGMFIAAQEKSPIARMVLNDVGPDITADSLRRIGEYVGRAPAFASAEEAEAYIRLVNAPFGDLSKAQWSHLTEHSIRRHEDGRWYLRYDPAIGNPFRQTMVFGDINLWPVYDQIRCPVLLTRGAESDLLSAATAAAMTGRGPRARRVDFEGVGHAPAFMDALQIEAVSEFLGATR